MPKAAGVVAEKGSEYILAHARPRELNGRIGGVGRGNPSSFRGDRDRELGGCVKRGGWRVKSGKASSG